MSFINHMLRRTGTVAMAMFYLVISAGFTLHAHYCGGKLVDLEMFSKPDHCCSKATACHKDNTKCCDDETIVIQLEEWQVASNLPVYEITSVDMILPVKPELIAPLEVPQTEFISTKPPPTRSEPLWLLYHRLTYYS